MDDDGSNSGYETMASRRGGPPPLEFESNDAYAVPVEAEGSAVEFAGLQANTAYESAIMDGTVRADRRGRVCWRLACQPWRECAWPASHVVRLHPQTDRLPAAHHPMLYRAFPAPGTRPPRPGEVGIGVRRLWSGRRARGFKRRLSSTRRQAPLSAREEELRVAGGQAPPGRCGVWAGGRDRHPTGVTPVLHAFCILHDRQTRASNFAG